MEGTRWGICPEWLVDAGMRPHGGELVGDGLSASRTVLHSTLVWRGLQGATAPAHGLMVSLRTRGWGHRVISGKVADGG
jgi:hypothetical protein